MSADPEMYRDEDHRCEAHQAAANAETRIGILESRCTQLQIHRDEEVIRRKRVEALLDEADCLLVEHEGEAVVDEWRDKYHRLRQSGGTEHDC